MVTKDTIQINSKSDLFDYIQKYTGLEHAAYHIGSGLEDGDSEEMCYENYYESTLLCDESERYIKLNISKTKILEVIKKIYYNETPSGIFTSC